MGHVSDCHNQYNNHYQYDLMNNDCCQGPNVANIAAYIKMEMIPSDVTNMSQCDQY